MRSSVASLVVVTCCTGTSFAAVTIAGRFRMQRMQSFLVAAGLAAFLCGASPALGATAPTLVELKQFAILGSSTVTSAGIATIPNGDVGVSPGTSITGSFVLSPGFAQRTPLTGDAALLISAQNDASNASTNLLAQGPGTTILAQLGGTTRTPGVYSFTSTADIANNNTFTLDAGGDPNAVWIFLVGSAITANTGSNVVFLNGVGNPCNVFWRVVSDATLLGLNFPGTVIAGAGGAGSVTVGNGANLSGRAVSLTAAVTTSGTGQTIGGCSAAPGGGCPLITVNPATLPNGTIGTAYSQTITASGGAAPYTFAVSSGTLPPGLTLSAGGLLSGTPTTIGTFSFTITATDLIDCPGSRDYTIVIAAAGPAGGGPAGGPTLDSFGLAILLVLLAVAGVFAVNRFTS